MRVDPSLLQPDDIQSVLNNFARTKQQLEETRKRNQLLEKTIANASNPDGLARNDSLKSENICPNPDSTQMLRDKIRQLESQNKTQLQNVDSLQKILLLKEKENQELKEDLRNADIALRTEFIRMEDFAEQVDNKYKRELTRLEEVNRELQHRLT